MPGAVLLLPHSPSAPPYNLAENSQHGKLRHSKLTQKTGGSGTLSIEKPQFDVGIIGGGPAGAAMASYLAKAGVSCVVFERELFPRPHVGESLVPSSTRVFKDLGFLEQMEEAKFPHKFGAAWTADDKGTYDMGWEGLAPDCHAEIRFEEREQPGVDKNHTYHV